jgi:hypothetical protein
MSFLAGLAAGAGAASFGWYLAFRLTLKEVEGIRRNLRGLVGEYQSLMAELKSFDHSGVARRRNTWAICGVSGTTFQTASLCPAHPASYYRR